VILIESFDPIEVGEINDFAFSYTNESFDAYILDADWQCRMTPFSNGVDDDPQSRIGISQVQSVVSVTLADGSLAPLRGQFAIARIGPFPPSAAGATYILRALGYMSDGRILARSGYVQCILPGQ
jgi:hypothetical protein